VGLVVADSPMTHPNIAMMVAAGRTAWRLIGLRPTAIAVVRQPFTHHRALVMMVVHHGDAALSTTSTVEANST